MNNTILLVDDDVRVLNALQRMLHRTYRIETANGPLEALGAVNQHGYAVVVSDLQMPGMTGVELLAEVKQLAPDTVRILLTGQADVDAAIGAVNEGSIFRFLTKPCPHETLCKTLDAALEQHRLLVAEKEVLQETLMGTVAILINVLSSIQPMAFGRASRLREIVRMLAAELGLPDSWELEAAAMLSQLGCISVDPRVLKRHYSGQELDEADRRHLLAQASVGRKLLHQVPRLQSVSQIIERQYQKWQGGSEPEPLTDIVAIGAQLLHVALDFDRLAGMGQSAADAVATMQSYEGEYHPLVFAALDRLKDKRLPENLANATGRDPSLITEQLIFRPLADEVLRTLRS
jgi:response regulator RpfG family c-di-GMP phosphodiesterase